MGLEIPQVNSCCYGCTSLRIGSLIIMWYYLISAILWIIVLTSAELNMTTNSTIVSVNGTASQEPFYIHNKIPEIYPYIGWIVPVVGILNVAVAVSGLYGAYKEKPKFILPTLVWEGIDVIVVAINFIRLMLLGPISFIVPFFIGLGIYLWLVIFSYFNVLRGANRSLV